MILKKLMIFMCIWLLNSSLLALADTLPVKMVAVGARGTIITSPDGISWSTQTSGVADMLMGIAWDPQDRVWIAVGGDAILRSTDGKKWTLQTNGVTNHDNLIRVAWNGKEWVAVGYDGDILTSFDGINWTHQNSGFTYNIFDVTWGDGKWIAVGEDSNILISTDGIKWTVKQIRSSIIPINLYTIKWANGQWIAAGLEGFIFTSTDAVNWVTRGVYDFDHDLEGAAWNAQNHQWLLVGELLSVVNSSDNGMTWVRNQVESNFYQEGFSGVVANGSNWVAVGGGGEGTGVIYTIQPDNSLPLKTKLTEVPSPTTQSLRGIATNEVA